MFSDHALSILRFIILVMTFCLLAHFLPTRSALDKIPGPKLYALTSLRLALDGWHARSVHAIYKLHTKYGSVVRVGPNQVSFSSLSALKMIYGAGNGFERTTFYRMFDVYGRPNLFTFASAKDHRERKKLLSHIYANQSVLSPYCTDLVKGKVFEFLSMLDREPQPASETFSSLHYFSLDVISHFVYGPCYGGTAALAGSKADRALLDDILNPGRRRLAWFAAYLPSYTKWIMTRSGIAERAVTMLGLMPMSKPFIYSGIREHALRAFRDFKAAPNGVKQKQQQSTVIGRLLECQERQGLSDMDIASECADHLLAGIDTTADSLMFMLWALALPKHHNYQEKLRSELCGVSIDQQGVPSPKDLTYLPYLNAVLRESLRLYSPLPAFEPRTSSVDTSIDDYHIPAGTVVGMSPYCLHRHDVFREPLSFMPERWLDMDGSLLSESDIQNKYFWAFSSGARMCIGIHLANAEMLTLVAAVVRKYRLSARHPDTSPGITSRFEVFYDECMSEMVEHECYIDFQLVDSKTQ